MNASAQTSVISSTPTGGTPSLGVTLTANTTSAIPGDAVVYTLAVVNLGDADASNLVVTNLLPNASYFTYGSCTGGCNHAAGTLTWNTGNLAAGASQIYTYTMNVGSTGLSAGITTVVDDVSVSGDPALSATSNPVTLSINGNPSLLASMSATPDNGLAPGDNITYSLTVENTGNVSAEAVIISAPIPTYTSFNGSINTSTGSGSFDAINNRVIFTLGNLAPGANINASFMVSVDALASGSTQIINSAAVSGANAQQRNLSTTATASATAVLELNHTASGSGAYPAAILTADASGNTLFVDRADRFYLNQYVRIGNTTGRITALSARSITLDTFVTATNGDMVVGAINLGLSYRNSGNALATDVTLTETLPSGLEYFMAVPASASAPLVGSSGTLSWSLGDLPAGDSGSRSVWVFPSGQAGTFLNQGLISASNAGDATADVSVMIGGLTVNKVTSTPRVSAGGVAKYEIILSNSLATPVTGIDLTDLLPTDFSYLPNSTTVNDVPSADPSFAPEDTSLSQPIWTGLTLGANASLSLKFEADVGLDVGPAAYQNELAIAAPASVGLQGFDALATKAEDVNVLAANTGLLQGYVFFRLAGSGNSFDAAADLPLAGVRVEIYKPGADCADPYSATCYVVYTDSDGYFEQLLAAEGWFVRTVAGTGALNASWSQSVGTNAEEVMVPDQGSVTDYNGYTGEHTVTATAGAGGTVAPTSRLVAAGMTTSFTITPDVGYEVDAATGSCGGSLSGTTYTTAAVMAACNINVTFRSLSHTVTFDLAGGTRTGGGALSQTVIHGQAATAPTLTPPVGKSFSGWNRSFNPVTSALTVTAQYADLSYSVSFDLAGGTRTGGGALSQTVIYGNSAVAPTLTPPAGQTFTGWNRGFTQVTGNLVVTAQYSSLAHQVTPSAGVGGSISPATAQTVAYGETIAFTVTPARDFVLRNVAGSCGGEILGNIFTTAPVTADCTLDFHFRSALLGQDLEGEDYVGETLSRNVTRRFRVSGGQGAVSIVATVMQAGDLSGNGEQAPATFLAEQGATLVDHGDGTYSFTATRTGMFMLTFIDEDGQEVSFVFTVHPQVAFTSTRQFGTAGEAARVRVVLDDDPVEYPVIAPFAVEGHTLADSIEASGEFVMTAGHLSTLTLVPLASSGEIALTLTSGELQNAVLGGLVEHKILLVPAANKPLTLSLAAAQGTQSGTVFLANEGLITLSSSLAGSGYTYDWSGSATALNIGNGNTSEVSVNPSGLAGVYLVRLRVTEVAAPHRELEVSMYLRILTSESTEYRAFEEMAEEHPYRLPICLAGGMERVTACGEVVEAIYMETLSNYQLRLGRASDFASWRDLEFALSVEDTDIVDDDGSPLANQQDHEYEHLGYRVDFELSGLEHAGESVPVVIPLQPGLAIVEDAVWRKFMGASGWQNFVENDRNTLSSARRNAANLCPWPADEAWQPGLTTGDDCVRLIIEDGGPNDLDGLANGTILDPSTLAVRAAPLPPPPPAPVNVTTTGKGRGGALDLGLLLLLSLLALIPLHPRRRGRVRVPPSTSSRQRDA